jgi:Tfp pilus assembly protein PilO
MKEIKKINKFAVFFTIIILEMVIIGGLLGYKLYYITKDLKLLNNDTVILQEETAKAQLANKLREEKTQTEQEIVRNRDEFFDDKDLLYFLKDFATVAKQYNLSVDTIRFGKLKAVSDTRPPIKELPINLSIKGNYDDLVKFLNYLEKYKHFTKPTDLSAGAISKIPGIKVGESKAGSISISLSFYVQTNSEDMWSYEK